MSNSGRYLQKKEKQPAGRGKKIGLIIAIVIVALLLVAAIGGVVYYNYVLGLINTAEYVEKNPSDEELEAILRPSVEDTVEVTTEATTEATTVATEPDYSKTGKIINIMLIGQASRGGEEAKLADTMILATLNRETKTLTLTSFLRDTYIKLPNYKGHTCGKNRINTCYALGYAWGDTLGAMEMLDMLILEQFGVEVDYNFEVDFEAFEQVINILGGIEVELTEAEATYLTNDDHNDGAFEAGLNLLDGDEALAYARMRKSSADDNDFKRTSRQRTVISKIIDKCRSMSLTDLNKLVTTILPMVTTDMPTDVITTYAMELLPIISDLEIVSNQCPAEGTYSGQIVEIYGVNSGVIVPDVQKNKELLMAIAEEPETAETQPTE